MQGVMPFVNVARRLESAKGMNFERERMRQSAKMRARASARPHGALALALMAVTLCARLVCAPDATGEGWKELKRVVGRHMNRHAAEGLSVAERIQIVQGVAGEAAAIRWTAKVSGPLVESASRDEFFALLDTGSVYVRAGTLHRAPAVDLAANLSALSDGDLNSYALECGIPVSFFSRHLPQYLRGAAETPPLGANGSESTAQNGARADWAARLRRQVVQQQVDALLRGPVQLRLAYLRSSLVVGLFCTCIRSILSAYEVSFHTSAHPRRPALQRLLQRFGKAGRHYNMDCSKIELVRKLTHAKYRQVCLRNRSPLHLH